MEFFLIAIWGAVAGVMLFLGGYWLGEGLRYAFTAGGFITAGSVISAILGAVIAVKLLWRELCDDGFPIGEGDHETDRR